MDTLELTQEDTLTELNRKVDMLAIQMAALTEHAELQQRRQREWDELKADLTPIMNEAYLVAVEQMAELEPHVQLEDLVNLLKRLARNTRNIEQLLDQLESLSDLLQDMGPIFNDAFMMVVMQMDQMERKGYFDVVREGSYVMDNIVEAFGPDDVRQLGDNIVTIMTTVKEMTQPEVMETVQSLTHRMRIVDEQPDSVDTSFLGLMKQLRDPETRRGLAVTLQMLKAVGEDQTADGKDSA